jgi:uncharacterized membrane protein YfcA
MNMGQSAIGGLDITTSLLALGVAVLSGLLSGLSGFGAGLMMSAFLVPVVGAKPTVALLAVAMVITNLGRIHAFGHRPDLQRTVYVLLGAIPAMVPCAWLLARISDAAAGLIVAITLIASIALRRIVKHAELHIGPHGLVTGGAVVGGVSGLSTGGGVMIIPLLLGVGLGGAALIATDAAISLTLHIARSLAFQRFALLDAQLFVLGIILGLATVPGSWLAARLVRRTGTDLHTVMLEVLVVSVALWIAVISLQEMNGWDLAL